MSDTMDLFGGRDTLAEAREELMAKRDEGSQCPCCDRWAQRYRRQVYHAQVTRMVRLFRLHLSRGFMEWMHIKEFDQPGGNEFAKLKHWGLVETKEKEEGEDKKASGYWRLTSKGIGFLRGMASIPETALVYNNICEGYDGPSVSVRECLEKDFSYEDLMHGIPPPADDEPSLWD